MQTINKVKHKMAYRYLDTFIDHLRKQGRYTFTFQELIQEFPKDKKTLHLVLQRLLKKKRIVRVKNGFYIIVPPEYDAWGVLPVPLFIDDLMRFLDRSYYIGLVSAAAMHGAGHQQPQIWTVMTLKPTLRPIKVKEIVVNFVFKTDFPTITFAKIAII